MALRTTRRFRNSPFGTGNNKTSLVDLGQEVAAKVMNPVAGTALPSPMVAPLPAKEASKKVQASEQRQVQDSKTESTKAQREEKPTSTGGGVSRKDARWREMYEELIEYKNNHDGKS